MAARTWWERPRLRTDEDEERERKVSWIELFSDLVFVVVIAQLAHYLAAHASVGGVAAYVLLFIPVWWVWIGGTFYTERFEADDVSFRLFTFLQLLPIAAMAVYAHDGLEGSRGFALAYAAARVLIIAAWLRGGLHEPRFRPVSNRYAAGFGMSVALFLLSALVPPPLRYGLWLAGLAVDFATPATTLRMQARLPRYSRSRLPERFGLFVIIVLGESIVGVVNGVADRGALGAGTALTATLGIALAFGLWWAYFDFVARRGPRPGLRWTLAWNYLHLPLVMGIAAVGAGVLNLIEHEGEALDGGVRWLLAGAVAVSLASLGVLELALRREPGEPAGRRASPSLKLAASAAALALGLGGAALGPAGLLSLALLLVGAQLAYGLYVWFRPVPARR